MTTRRASKILIALVVPWLLSSCGTDRARVMVELSVPASAQPLVFHGNCFAGFLLGFELRVSETEGAGLDLDALSFEVRDSATAEVLGGEALDATGLRARYGAEALHLGPRGSRTFEVRVRVSASSTRSLAVAGEVGGADAVGPVRQPYRLALGEVILAAPDPSTGGACSP